MVYPRKVLIDRTIHVIIIIQLPINSISVFQFYTASVILSFVYELQFMRQQMTVNISFIRVQQLKR